MSSCATIVLVPGAWSGAWSWHPVAQSLRAAGHDPRPMTLPGLAWGDRADGLKLADASRALAHEIVTRDLRDVALVAHSWGGYPAAGAAALISDRVSSVIFYNAVVPQPGVSMADENPEYGSLIHAAIAATPDQTVPIPYEAVRDGMLPEVAPEVARLVWQLMRPQPGRYLTDVPTGPAVADLDVRLRYVLGDDDRALARPGEEFAERLGVQPTRIPGGHSSLISTPDVVAEALRAVIEPRG